MQQRHKRKYCSKTCGNKYKLRQKKPDVQETLLQHDLAVFEEAVNTYRNCSGGAEIARKYEMPARTVYSWIHDFGRLKERADIATLPRGVHLNGHASAIKNKKSSECP
jgi:transposase-like protein